MTMDAQLKTSLWQQFGATIDMLSNAVRACPDELWEETLWNDRSIPRGFSEFWYVVSHVLFWLDFYLTGRVEGFAPPEPFTLVEFDPAGKLPDRVYTKEELLTYLAYGREKCRTTIEALTDEKANVPCKFPWGEISFGALLLYNMRHVQEHGAQLSLFLGQRTGFSPRWVTKAKD